MFDNIIIVHGVILLLQKIFLIHGQDHDKKKQYYKRKNSLSV